MNTVQPIIITNDEGEEIPLPCRYELCPRCGGHGQHVNPSIDSHGIGADEWRQWDDEEREAYFRGDYDVSCHKCHGLRVVAVVDEDRLSPDLARQWHAWCESEREFRATQAAERRMGA